MPATSIEPSAKHLRELSVDEASLVSGGSALKAALAWAGAFVSSSGGSFLGVSDAATGAVLSAVAGVIE
jgi:hypothetical protein